MRFGLVRIKSQHCRVLADCFVNLPLFFTNYGQSFMCPGEAGVDAQCSSEFLRRLL